ncbi:hypothetical protein GCM10010287_61870 [Streptomyces variabilis]|uniref:Uncharacterized protein n=1 Tax=Streptomyces variabilis TaxID=67372 RepID=A0ABQ2U844_9ACTN|nr:hypothetical protein GCM10010265_62550 [Streptomyces griseoincarnatus]GGT79241.1 hypothetical protein GCM10010287_61870 [Streptomyces variabilis]
MGLAYAGRICGSDHATERTGRHALTLPRFRAHEPTSPRAPAPPRPRAQAPKRKGPHDRSRAGPFRCSQQELPGQNVT